MLFMEIHLRPELEAQIQRDVERGPYESVDEFVEHAVSLLLEREAWLSENRVGIATKIEEGYAAAQRGELIDSNEVRARLSEMKRSRSSES